MAEIRENHSTFSREVQATDFSISLHSKVVKFDHLKSEILIVSNSVQFETVQPFG